ncbi:VIT1/CCC1 transporter family protein [Acidaminobacter sp. JC074]|uniref:VIT1/CCC1 transporter family protein n=1 Tax=Acidaminobacter sp. JC074 TaxID=2530199 RepID=UPI001F0F70A7|nr:VIT1/CCC1 transporter family protein [Acidaminobacter sp. JC074]
MVKDKEALLLKAQKNEMYGEGVYRHLSNYAKDKNTKSILLQIAESEKSHYQTLAEFSGRDLKINGFFLKLLLMIVSLAVNLLGLTFVLKFLERMESRSAGAESFRDYPDIYGFIVEEEKHEKLLLDALNEDRLKYMGSVVLGLNDALVELTGTLAGFTLSIQNSRTIAVIGLITGISASFSMAASEYLSSKEEATDLNPKKASLYTGIAYVLTVLLLVLPFFHVSNYMLALGLTLLIALLIIAFFNYYISVAKDEPFKSRFMEMALISIGVAVVSFGIGYLVKTYIGIEI